MNSKSPIEDPAPLQTSHIPSEFVDREKEQEQLEDLLSEDGLENLFLHGPSGTGKTHILFNHLKDLPDGIKSCYIPCRRCDTQYKALKQLYKILTEERISSGFHTAKLHRKIEEQTEVLKTVVVLDDIEFLLLKDNDNLLYKLSRTNPQQLTLILTSSHHTDLENQLEERTYSSLQPRRIQFESYTGQQICKILKQRAQDSLKPQSVQREALTYIASSTSHAGFAISWLQTSATQNTDRITEETVKQSHKTARKHFINQLLSPFDEDHRLVYQAIQELEKEQGSPIQTGQVYQRYKELCQAYSHDQVSNRRISTFLKQLERLNLIQAKYHYGGQKGKTREMETNRF